MRPSAAGAPRSTGAPSASAPVTAVTPAPRLVQTGADYAAIARSIDGYHGWLLAHRPDPARAGAIYQRGTQSYVDFTRNLDALRRRHETLVSVGQRCTYAVASTGPTLVTLRVHEVLREDRVLDVHGRVVSVTPYSEPNDYVVVLTRGADARWRFADVTQVSA